MLKRIGLQKHTKKREKDVVRQKNYRLALQRRSEAEKVARRETGKWRKSRLLGRLLWSDV